MFTGIVEELGVVERSGARLKIQCGLVLEDSREGSSIAVNGVCLTAVDLDAGSFTADLAPETMRDVRRRNERRDREREDGEKRHSTASMLLRTAATGSRSVVMGKKLAPRPMSVRRHDS